MCRPCTGIDHMVEAQQRQQRRTLRRRNPRFEVEFALLDLVQRHPAQGRGLWLACDGDGARKLRRTEVDNTADIGLIGMVAILVDAQRQVGQSVEQYVEGDRAFQTRQRRADAVMQPVAKGDVRIRVARDVQFAGVGEARRITVGSSRSIPTAGICSRATSLRERFKTIWSPGSGVRECRCHPAPMARCR